MGVLSPLGGTDSNPAPGWGELAISGGGILAGFPSPTTDPHLIVRAVADEVKSETFGDFPAEFRLLPAEPDGDS